MQNLEKRISDLEAKAASTDHRTKVYLCNEGEDATQARAKAGIAPDFAGKTIRVEFVASPNASKGVRHE